MRILKKTIIYGSLLLVVLMLSGFALLPHLVERMLIKQLPPGVSLTQFEMAYPNFSQVSFTHVELLQLADNGTTNRVNLKDVVLSFDWNLRRLSQVSIEQVSADIEFIPRMPQNNLESPQSGDTVPLFIPPISIASINANLASRSDSPLALQGQLNTLNGQPTLSLALTAVDKSARHTSANITLTRENSESYTLIADMSMELAQLASLQFDQQRMPVLPVELVQGLVKLDLSSQFLFSDAGFTLEQLSAQLNVLNAQVYTPELAISALNAHVSIDCIQAACRSSTLRWSGVAELPKAIPQVNKVQFPFTVDVNHFAATSSSMNLRGQLTLDKQQAFNFDSQSSKTNQVWASRNDIQFKLNRINHDWFPALTDASVESIQGKATITASFENSRVKLTKFTTQGLVASGVKYRGEFPASLDRVEVKAGWKKDPLSASIPFDTLEIKVDRALFEAKPYNLAAPAGLTFNLRDDSSAIFFSGVIKPLVEKLPANQSGLFTSGELAGSYTKHSGLVELKLNTNTQVTNLKPLLKNSLKAHRKIISEVIIKDVKTQTLDSVNLYSDLLIRVPVKAPPQLKGVIKVLPLGLILAKNKLVNLQFNARWQDSANQFQAWSRFDFTADTQLNFQGIDIQQHSASGTLDLGEAARMQNFELASQVFGGQLLTKANAQLNTLDKLDGTVELMGLDLGKVNAMIGKQTLKVSGVLSGTIPFIMHKGSLRFMSGQLTSQMGKVEYLPDGNKKVLSKDNISEIANIALQNFHYTALDTQIISGGPCGFDIKFRLQGKNPELSSKQEQIFNINYAPQSNVNLYYLLLLGEDFIKQSNQESLGSACVNAN